MSGESTEAYVAGSEQKNQAGRLNDEAVQLLSQDRTGSAVSEHWTERLAGEAYDNVVRPAGELAWDGTQPGVSALATRGLVLGLSGRLHYNLDDVARVLSKMDSPMAPQFADRLVEMKKDGWRFDAVSKNRWQLSPAGLVNQPTETLGTLNKEVRVLTFEKPGLMKYWLGVEPHPLKGVASIVAHEMAHKDGILSFSENQLAKGDPAELRTKALRTLASETNASLAEIHVAGALRDTRLAQPLMEAAKTGDLGGYIWETYQSESMKQLTRPEAKDFVNKWIHEQYGPDTVDSKNGHVKAFDLNKSRIFIGQTLAYDAEFGGRLSSPNAYLFYRDANAATRFQPLGLPSMSETRTGGRLMEGTKILGSLGAFTAASDVMSSFAQSKGAGFGRLAGVGTGLAGFELGACLARASCLAPKPLRILGAGFVAAFAADHTIGVTVESKVKRLIDS